MKKAFIYIVLILAIAFASLGTVMAQPHPGEQSGGSTDPVTGGRIGEGAPVGNGTFILLTLALAYAGRKMYQGRMAEEKTE